MINARPQATHSLEIETLTGGEAEKFKDVVAVEEPLEIRLHFAERSRPLSITMRTPGNDRELAAGFLFTEGILDDPANIQSITHTDTSTTLSQSQNVVNVELSPGVDVDFSRLERHFYTSSSCGVCGKTSIQALRTQSPYVLQETFQMRNEPLFSADIFYGFHGTLENRQGLFSQTGGIHASGLFNSQGELLQLYEDVGRHNALDKLIGAAFLRNELPFKNNIVMVSGRASFELVQKAAMGGANTLVAVGAPSSLAVQLAEEFGMTLIGFLKRHRFNIYSGAWRIKEKSHEA